MQRTWTRGLYFTGAFLASAIMALSAGGCASGGFKLTRQYAGWVNSQNLIIRIILYILTSIVFAVTLLIDLVVFNTMDFWEGRVSQGTYQFQDGEKTFYVNHEVLPDTKLRRSTIEVKDKSQKLMQVVVLKETPAKEIELYVDGKLRSQVKNIFELPIISMYDAGGKLVESKLFFDIADSNRVLARK